MLKCWWWVCFCCHFVCHEVIKERMVKNAVFFYFVDILKEVIAQTNVFFFYYYYSMVAGCMYFSNRLWTSLVYCIYYWMDFLLLLYVQLRTAWWWEFVFISMATVIFFNHGLGFAEFIIMIHINAIESILRQGVSFKFV